MDRPRQIQRAFGRLAHPEQRQALNERLVVRPGPPPRDLARHPEVLAYMANMAGAATVFVDSLKDAAIGLSDDEVGAGLNRAMQIALAEGIEVAALHHQRKGQNGTRPKTLEDVYGSTWVVAGAGSVLLLWGTPGDALVELIHLKQPGGPVGPPQLEHDHATGRSSTVAGFDPLRYLRGQPDGATAEAFARARFNRQPSARDQANARSQLNRLLKAGKVHKVEAIEGGAHGTRPARWYLVDRRQESPR
jgi:replicative DNA helicase